MLKFILAAFCGIIFSLCAGAQVRSSTLSLDDILSQYFSARGGYDKIAAIGSLVSRERYSEGRDSLILYMAVSVHPYARVVGEDPATHPDYLEGFDGSTWEYYADPGVVLRTVGAAAAGVRHSGDIDPFLDYKQHRAKVSLRGIAKVGSRNDYEIIIEHPDGFKRLYFIDAHSFRLIASRQYAEVHAFGKKVESEEVYSNFQTISGIVFALTSREINIKTGAELSKGETTSIVVNPVLSPMIFAPPQFVRTPKQEFLEKLFYERADKDALAYSYVRFRVDNPQEDIEKGVEFIGFQMAKMGDYPGSLELLSLNLADHPASPAALFGLGRAYRSKGDETHAVQFFRRALAIDPKFQRALDALKPH